jgi:hypothetical protein
MSNAECVLSEAFQFIHIAIDCGFELGLDQMPDQEEI